MPIRTARAPSRTASPAHHSNTSPMKMLASSHCRYRLVSASMPAHAPPGEKPRPRCGSAISASWSSVSWSSNAATPTGSKDAAATRSRTPSSTRHSISSRVAHWKGPDSCWMTKRPPASRSASCSDRHSGESNPASTAGGTRPTTRLVARMNAIGATPLKSWTASAVPIRRRPPVRRRERMRSRCAVRSRRWEASRLTATRRGSATAPAHPAGVGARSPRRLLLAARRPLHDRLPLLPSDPVEPELPLLEARVPGVIDEPGVAGGVAEERLVPWAARGAARFQDRVLRRVLARAERPSTRGVADGVELAVVCLAGVEEVVPAALRPHRGRLDDRSLPAGVVRCQPHRQADELRAVRREPLPPEVRGVTDRIAVVLPVEVERAVTSAERACVDRAALVPLAHERRVPPVDEGPLRVVRDGAADALAAAVRRVVEDVAPVVERQHLRRPGLAGVRPRAHVWQCVGARPPLNEVVRRERLHLFAGAVRRVCVVRVADAEDERVRDVAGVHRVPERFRTGAATPRREIYEEP